jgi:tRNA1(Val) A37 N6-methylase TrmN6
MKPAEVDRCALTEDAFLGGRLRILQPRKGYRAGLDAVLLAAATPVRGDSCERVLEAGAGVGVVGLCIAARAQGVRVTLVESDPELVAIARENALRNGLEHRIDVIGADVTAPPASLEAEGLASGLYTHVVANPPYLVQGRGRTARDPAKAAAHAMPAGDLARWVRFLTRVAAPGASLTMIHRPEVLPELLALLERRFGGLRLLPVHPRTSAPAVRILIEGRKGSRSPLKLLAGLVLHETDGSFRPEIAEILRNGAALRLEERT